MSHMNPTPIADPSRNEHFIRLGTFETVLRPTYRFIVTVESEFDLSMFELVTNLVSMGRIKTEQIVRIILIASKEAGFVHTPDEIREAVFNAGYLESVTAISGFLSSVYAGSSGGQKGNDTKSEGSEVIEA